MPYPINNMSTSISASQKNLPLIIHISKFIVAMIGTALVCLGAYALTVDHLVERSAIPATYKWFLLKETPGPRIIFESGSNSHHAINTDAVGEALGRTAINIADNGGYALEDKLTRLETYTRPGDVVILPLEWTFYHREKLTDNYVDTLFDSNRDYYLSMPFDKRVKRALSLPPATIISKLVNHEASLDRSTESPAQDLFVSALTQPTGHQSKAISSGPRVGVAEQSCDDYILGKAPIRQNLKLGKNVKPALARLKKLKARGVDIHFAWPVLAGEACLTSSIYFEGFRTQIEKAVNDAGFKFLGTPSQSLYGQTYQDDTPYHIITEATDIHTQKMIGFLQAQGYNSGGNPLNITDFARHRLFELELAEATQLIQPPLQFGQTLSMDDADQRDHIDFTAGWWDFEPYGRWMRDNRAMLRLTLPETLPADTVLKIQGSTKSGKPEEVDISVNGKLMASGVFGESAPLLVPVINLPLGETLSIFIDLPSAGVPRSPKELGENEDARSMTLHLQTLELIKPINMIETTPPKEATNQRVEAIEINSVFPRSILQSGTIPNSCALALPATTNTKSTIQYGDGWWAQEAEGRWMKGEDASFEIKGPATGRNLLDGDQTLRLVGKFFSTKPRAVTVTVNGEAAPLAKLTDSGTIYIPVNASMDISKIKITLNLSMPNIQSPKDLGLSTDDRSLTYFLKSVAILPA